MAFTDRIRRLPEVLDIYFLAGADDFLLHVRAARRRGAAGFRRRPTLRPLGGGAHRDQPDLRTRPRRFAVRVTRVRGRADLVRRGSGEP